MARNLDEVTRNVYKENLKLAESFKVNSRELETLRKVNRQLEEQNEYLKGQLEDNGSLVKDRVEQANKQAKQIRELTSKCEILEKSLAQVVKEFEHERENIMKTCKIQLESSTSEIEKLRKTLELRNRETNRIKKLAKNILEQRSEIERFFLDSLDFVRRQIITNRNEYRKEANAAYNNRMLAAFSGQAEYPKIRTFSKKFDAFSTNNVYKDLEEAEKWYIVQTFLQHYLSFSYKNMIITPKFRLLTNNKRIDRE